MQYVTTHVFPIIGSDSGPIVGKPEVRAEQRVVQEG